MLTTVVRIGGGADYYWYELLAATEVGVDGLLLNHDAKMVKLLAVREDFLGTAEAIAKTRSRFEQEFNLLQIGLPGICRGYEILQLPIGDSSIAVQAIVMDRVPGENLEEYLKRNGAIDEKRARRWLSQLLTTLQKLHQQGIQHRDIKPSNIIVSGSGLAEQLTIIDLGIAKDWSQNGNTTNTVSGSFGYIDPLYANGDRSYQNDSDLYSLAKTMLRLLTNKQMETIGNDWLPFVQHPPLSPEFIKMIDRAMSIDPQKRFTSAQQWQQQLQPSKLSQRMRQLIALVLGCLGMGIILVKFLFFNSNSPRREFVPLHTICNIPEINCGENPWQLKSDRQGGGAVSSGIQTDFIESGSADGIKRSKAITRLEEKRNKAQDEPAILISLNNAKLYRDKANGKLLSKNIYTILVAVPDQTPETTMGEISRRILHGVAKIQESFNKESKDWKLHVAVLSDKDIKKGAEGIAEEIAKRLDNNFVGVIGHYSSTKTFELLPAYNKHNIFLLSPSASRTNAGEADGVSSFARLVDSTRVASNKMIDVLRSQVYERGNCDGLEVQMVYENDGSFSMSFAEELKDAISSSLNLTLLGELSICSSGCDNKTDLKKPLDRSVVPALLKKALAASKSPKQCQSVALIPGAYAMENHADTLKEITKVIPQETALIGHDTIYDRDFLQYLGNSRANSNFIVIPWHPMNLLSNKKWLGIRSGIYRKLIDEEYPKDMQDLDWRIITSADATEVYIEAVNRRIKQGDKAQTIREIIKNPDFQANGVSGLIRFDSIDKFNRRGTQMVTAVKSIPYCKDKKKSAAVPLNYRDPRQPIRVNGQRETPLANCYEPLPASYLK